MCHLIQFFPKNFQDPIFRRLRHRKMCHWTSKLLPPFGRWPIPVASLIHIEIPSMHSNYSNLSFYRNTLIDSSIWWMYPIWVEKFETTCKIRLLQIWHDVQDSFTTNVARRARFSDKKLARRARFLLRFTQFELKSLRQRARFFYYKFSTTGKILLRQFYPIPV